MVGQEVPIAHLPAGPTQLNSIGCLFWTLALTYGIGLVFLAIGVFLCF